MKITMTFGGVAREFSNLRDAVAFIKGKCLNCTVQLSKQGGLFCRDCYRTLHPEDKKLMTETMRGKLVVEKKLRYSRKQLYERTRKPR